MTSIDPHVLVEEIVWTGIEDYGLFYEIIWSMNNSYPKIPVKEKNKYASYWVKRLLDEECIAIVKLDESEHQEVGVIKRALINLEPESPIWVFNANNYDRTVRFFTTPIGTGLVQINSYREEILARVYRNNESE